MASIPLSTQPSSSGNLRPLNILRDLPKVADLIELCFASSMDSEGQSYIRQMRRTGKDDTFMRWATNAIESTSMPLSGFVWEQDGKIIGNTSLVPFRHKGKRIYLIANVATHPDHRRQGIAQALTEKAIRHARQRGTEELWLHVRADNPGAVTMYQNLGFVERARRTTWQASKEGYLSPAELSAPGSITITRRYARFWPQQLAWLKQLHPDDLNWYRSLNWNSLRPGLLGWLYRIFIEFDQRQWAVQKNGELQGVVSYLPALRQSPLWLACSPNSDRDVVYTLLRRAQRDLGYRSRLRLEHPEGLHVDGLTAAGFSVYRTLIWMSSKSET